jgi:hypothetical protein
VFNEPSTAHNNIKVVGYTFSNPAPGYTGTPDPTDIVNLQIVSATSNGQLAQDYIGTVAGPAALLNSSVAPVVASGFGTGAVVQNANGTWSFQVYVGTGGTATSGVLTMPTGAHVWACHAEDNTTVSSTVFRQRTVGTANTLTITNLNTSAAAAAWTSGDFLEVACGAN